MNYYKAYEKLPAKYRAKFNNDYGTIRYLACCAAVEGTLAFQNCQSWPKRVEKSIIAAIRANKTFCFFFIPQSPGLPTQRDLHYRQVLSLLRRLPASQELGTERNPNSGNDVTAFCFNLKEAW